jgi:hypothetical protein
VLIGASIKQAVRKAADRVHPTRGVAQLASDVALDLLPIGTALKAGALYVAQVAPRPISAAAFMLDLQEAAAAVQPQV